MGIEAKGRKGETEKGNFRKRKREKEGMRK
jgi:hypothetical protein